MNFHKEARRAGSMGTQDAHRTWKKEKSSREKRGDSKMSDLANKNTTQDASLNTARVIHSPVVAAKSIK